MNNTESVDTPSREEQQETNQYDTILRTVEKGLLLTINNSVKQLSGTDQMVVEYSYDDKTEVSLRSQDGARYKIHRDGVLIYSEVTKHGLSYEGDVISIEVVGIE